MSIILEGLTRLPNQHSFISFQLEIEYVPKYTKFLNDYISS